MVNPRAHCRCLFPECPAAQNCASCAEAGVLGPVPGAIGTLQATEAIKLATGVGEPLAGTLLLYDALRADFRRVKLRPARPGCAACAGGDYAASQLARAGGPAGFDYDAFTGGQALTEGRAPVQLLPPERRIDCAALRHLLQAQRQAVALPGSQGCVHAARSTPPSLGKGSPSAALGEAHNAQAGADMSLSEDRDRTLVLDVRAHALFQASRLPGSFNVPWSQVRHERC